jgi:hypothetical protein
LTFRHVNVCKIRAEIASAKSVEYQLVVGSSILPFWFHGQLWIPIRAKFIALWGRKSVPNGKSSI